MLKKLDLIKNGDAHPNVTIIVKGLSVWEPFITITAPRWHEPFLGLHQACNHKPSLDGTFAAQIGEIGYYSLGIYRLTTC